MFVFSQGSEQCGIPSRGAWRRSLRVEVVGKKQHVGQWRQRKPRVHMGLLQDELVEFLALFQGPPRCGEGAGVVPLPVRGARIWGRHQ